MFRRLIVLTSLYAAALGSAAQEPIPADVQNIEGIVAVVNDDLISYTDVRQRARLLLLSLGGQTPTQEQIQQLTSEALDQLIDEKLQLQEAKEYEVEVTDGDIANSIENIARQSGVTREDLVNSLLQSGINPSSLEDQTRADIAWRRIMGGLYGTRIRISEDQISGQLTRLKASAEKEQFQLAEIFLFAPLPEDREQALVAANSIKEQLEAGAPFNLAAQRFSSAPTAATGGDMGWVTLEDLDDARAAAIGAAPGDGMLDPIAVEDGVYLMSIKARRQPSQRISRVDLTRITVGNGSEADLLAAAEAIGSCAEIDAVTNGNSNLTAVPLMGVNVEELGPEGKAMVISTPVGGHTDIFAQSGTLALMFVCSRDDNVDDLPTKAQIEDSLYAQQLGMISQRSLRNLRREATIIRR